jgi:hypothetical protein
VEPLSPDQAPRRGGRWADHPTVLNEMLWRARCGGPAPPVDLPFGTLTVRRWAVSVPKQESRNRHRGVPDTGGTISGDISLATGARARRSP